MIYFFENLSRKQRDKGWRAQRHPSGDDEKEEGEQGKETSPKQRKISSVAEAVADTQAKLEAQSAIPSAGMESGKERACQIIAGAQM